MSAEWEETTLADISANVSYGYTESASDQKVGPRFLRITDIQNGVVNWSNVPYCPISKADHGKYRLQSGDIVVARTGNSTGENFLYRGIEDAVFASYLIRFRINPEEADPAFIWYNLRSKRWWNFINSSKTGSAQPGANAKVLGQFPVSLPPLTEQKSIAQILASLDDKIELNRRMNETLEALAQSLFKSWFVDATQSALPKGWREVPLPEAIRVNPPRPLRKGEVAPYLDMANMPTRSARALEIVDREFGSGMRFKNGDTLVARITPCLENGKTCFVDFLNDDQIAWGSTEYIVLQPKSPLPPEFAYFLARTDEFRAFMISNMTGTTGRQRVPAECLSNFKVAIHPAELAET